MDVGVIFGNSFAAAVGPLAAIYAVAAIGLNVHFGYTGLLNFGQVAFLLLGAYGVAITVSVYHGPLWLGVIFGIAAAAGLALLLGIPTLRLRGDYLAIATIAAGEILRIVWRSSYLQDFSGGVYGLQRFADDFYRINPIPSGHYGIGQFDFSNRDLWAMLVGWSVAGLCTLLLWRLVHSPWGRVLRSIREEEDAARALGKNVFGYKLSSLVLGGVFGALGGMLFAVYTQSVNPDTFNPVLTFYLYAILILGGAGRIWGPVVGSVVFWFLLTVADVALRQAIGAGYIPSSILTSSDIGAVRFALVGLGLMLLMAFRPAGLIGNRRELALDEL